MEHISSTDNKKVKNAVKLRTSSKFRKQSGLFFCEGARLCFDAYLSGLFIDTAFITSDYSQKFPEECTKITAKAESVYTVSDGVMAKLSDTVNPQGVALVLKMPTTENTVQNGVYIALENTQDPANLGAIARSAEAFGAKGIILSALGCDPFSSKSLRASMGAFFRIPLTITTDFIATVNALKSDGAKILTSVVSGNATPLGKVAVAEKTVLIIGNEGNGVTDSAVSVADETVTIPMTGRAESLNASVAAAIMIYELTKMRE